MRIIIDDADKTVTTVSSSGEEKRFGLYSPEGFRSLSDLWIKQEWNSLHWQSFSWCGFPIWQFPEDLMRLQESVFTIKPDVIIETGVSRGGSAVFFASICRLMGKGKVISIDITIPQEVRRSIGKSPFSDLITLIEGSSVSDDTVRKVKENISAGEKVFVFLDSDHSRNHVSKELEIYATLVGSGSYIVAADGIMERLADTPNGRKEWLSDNPAEAAREFVRTHPEFKIERPGAMYGEAFVVEELTYWPDAWITRA